MNPGSLVSTFKDRANPVENFVMADIQLRGGAKVPPMPKLFGNAGVEHMEKYGTTKEHFAKIAWKNHKHSVNNPYAQFRDEYTLEQILAAPMISSPLTKL